MPRKSTTYSIFVASPSDVLEERERLEQVISEINEVWGRQYSINLELVRWETHAVPGLGADAQDVINREIPDDFDVFIGIMWQRFGTPTGREESGTIEEFRRAKARFDQDPDSIKVMFYFKDKPVPIASIDATQIEKVQRFRRELGELGGLFWQFDEADDFEKLVRVHLQRLLQGYRNDPSLPAPLEPRQPANVPIVAEDDGDSGAIDYILEFGERFERATQEMASTNAIINEMTASIEQHASDLSSGSSEQSMSGLRRAKKVMVALAADMDVFGERISKSSQSIFENLEAGGDAMVRFLEMQPNDPDPSVGETISQLDNAVAAVAGYRQAITRAAEGVLVWPRTIKELNLAKRKLHATLEEIARGYERSEALFSEIRKTLVSLRPGQDA